MDLDMRSNDNSNATILRDVSLEQYNTLRLKAVASLMAFPHNECGIVYLINKYRKQKKIIIIGKGSNILLSKEYYNEDTLFINLALMNKIELFDDKIFTNCGATLSELSWFAIEKGIKGFEFLEDIPGTIGGALIMNAGTYRNYIADLVTSVKYYDFSTNNIVNREIDEDDFSRRSSYWMKNESIIIACSFRAEKGNYIDSLEKVLETKKDRFLKQPRNYPSAGSVFVRPKKDLGDLVAWELIDKVGLRGFSRNGAAYSDKHPGFIINKGDATYDDILYLIKLAQERVKNEFNVDLRVEWRII